MLVRRDGTTTPATVRWVLARRRPRRRAAGVGGRRGPRHRRRRGCRSGDDGYRSVVEAVHEGVVVHAPDGTIVSCNPSAERILRLTAGEIVGRDWSHWQPVREDGSAVRTPTRTPTAVAAATGRPQTDVVMGLHTAGGERALDRRQRRAGAGRRRSPLGGRGELLRHRRAPARPGAGQPPRPDPRAVARRGARLRLAHAAARAGEPQRGHQHRLHDGRAPRDDPARPAPRARRRTPSRPSSSRCAAATSSGSSSRRSTGAATARPTRSRCGCSWSVRRPRP